MQAVSGVGGGWQWWYGSVLLFGRAQRAGLDVYRPLRIETVDSAGGYHMSAAPGALFCPQIPCSIAFAPDLYPAELILREADGMKGAPGDRYRLARRAVLDTLFRELRLICSSAVIQCCASHPRHVKYGSHAAESRARIARGLRSQL